jgi:hypothetical protein
MSVPPQQGYYIYTSHFYVNLVRSPKKLHIAALTPVGLQLTPHVVNTRSVKLITLESTLCGVVTQLC